MSAYVFSVVNKTDRDAYERYSEAGYLSILPYRPEVTVAESPEVIEGKFPGTTTIMMKFKTMEDAKAWYHSDLYQKAIPLRHAASDTSFVIMFHGTD